MQAAIFPERAAANARHLLLVAYQCAPGADADGRIGWEWYRCLAQSERVTLVTHARNRAALTAAGAPLAGSRVIYIAGDEGAGPFARFCRGVLSAGADGAARPGLLDYLRFDWLAWRALAAERRAGADWAVLHRVTPATLAAPTWLGRLGVPLVLGPLNSRCPSGLTELLPRAASWQPDGQRLGRWLDYLLGSSRRAACILAATPSTAGQLATGQRMHCRLMGESGVDPAAFVVSPWPQPPARREPLRILFVGRLTPDKALPLLLDAVAALLAEGYLALLTVVGDGPQRQAWEDYAAEQQLGRRVLFLGAQPAAEVARQLQACHVLCQPAPGAGGAAVVLEAMASARPVIALNLGAAAEIVDQAVGALVAPGSPAAVTNGIAACLRDVIRRPQVWKQRGEAARRRVEQQHAWPAKVEQAKILYRQLIAAAGCPCMPAVEEGQAAGAACSSTRSMR